MKKTKKSLVLVMTGAILSMSLASCNNNTTSSAPVTYDDYGIASDLMGAELMGKIHDKMMTDHTVYYTYGSVRSNFKDTDKDPDKDGNVILFYTGKSVSASSSMTREHVWACANSNGMWDRNSSTNEDLPSTYKGGGSDLYHIRPLTGSINTLRGNSVFMEFPDDAVEDKDYYVISETGGKYSFKADSNTTFAKNVEPADEYKGDIVRIIMYLYVHYSSLMGDNSNLDDTQKSYLGNLRLTDVFGSNKSATDIQKLMIRWNELDPVDNLEKNRNDTVQGLQGNRNPFVDHPEYMTRCFDLDEE